MPREFQAFGESKTLLQWSKDSRCGVHYHTLRKLLKKGIPLPEALVKQPVVKPNRRLKLTAFGETKALAEWTLDDRCNVTTHVLLDRIKAGLTPEQAISLRHRYGNLAYAAFGESKLLADWIRDPRCVVTFQALYKRVLAGMPIEEAMTTTMSRHIPKHKIWPPITAFGETKSVMDWARDVRCPVSEVTLRKRLVEGQDPEEAIVTPTSRRPK